MRVVIAGATGMVGRELTHLCTQEKAVEKVFVLVRKQVPAFEDEEKIHQIIVDYNTLSEKDLPANIDVAFCCLGTTMRNAQSRDAFRKVDYDYVTGLASICRFRKVRKFIAVSAMGADIKSRMFYNQVKGEMEDYLMNDSHLDNILILRPSLLLGQRREFRLAEKLATVVMTTFNALFIGNLRQYKAIPGKVVAQAMINLAKMEDEGKKIIPNDLIFDVAKLRL
ncbi:NAD(P)H-binding protein [bacterium SCSIO 12741]|nr:NAD(P)H-binding protein [bacterium SCSIO 12741]